MEDSQKKGMGARSGGQKIDDHSFWAGSRSKDSVFPAGPYKVKNESSADVAGSVLKYEDTTAAIKAHQNENTRKAKAHQGRLPQYRN